jgi:signal-transduction protein with cAMP-binding, CBS, and nucleotidyltransferase domain
MSANLVSDVMHEGLIACWSHETLIEVARRLCEDSIHAIFVMNRRGQVNGIISQTDLADAYVQGDWQELTAYDIMTDTVISVTGETPLDVAVGLMLNQNIHRVLVVQEGRNGERPVGVLSLSDVVCEMAAETSLLDEDELELAG